MDEFSDKDLKHEIQGLINDSSDSPAFPEFDVEPVEPIDLGAIKTKTKQKAQKVVLSCLKLYFDEKIISKNDFMQAKAAVTTSSLQSLFRQIKIAEHMVDRIVNRTDTGDYNPRLFEVANQIQSNIVDMLKNVQIHVISMQEDFRRMQGELPKSELNPKNIEIESSQSSKVYTNAKSLLNDLDEEDNTEDVDAEEVD